MGAAAQHDTAGLHGRPWRLIASMSGQLLRRTLRPDRQNRAHDRVLILGQRHSRCGRRRAVGRYGAPLQRATAVPMTVVSPATTRSSCPDLDQQRIRRRPVLGGLINESERAAQDSRSTHAASSGTRQGASVSKLLRGGDGRLLAADRGLVDRRAAADRAGSPTRSRWPSSADNPRNAPTTSARSCTPTMVRKADSTGGFQPVEQGGGQRAAGDAGGGAGTQPGQLEQRATRVCGGCLVRG